MHRLVVLAAITVFAFAGCTTSPDEDSDPEVGGSELLQTEICSETDPNCDWLYASDCDLWPDRTDCQPEGSVVVETWDCADLGLDETCRQHTYVDDVGRSPFAEVSMP